MKSGLLKPTVRSAIGDAFRGALLVGAVVLIASVIGLGFALVQGYRPVIITTGSMDPTAPPGSVLIAGPTSQIAPGDILVMRRDGRATITHRVVEIEVNDAGNPFAVTRGDANANVDAAPYALGQQELIGRWVIPRAGNVLLAVDNPFVGILAVAGAVLVLSLAALRHIWGPDPDDAPRSPAGLSSAERNSPGSRIPLFGPAGIARIRRAGLSTILGVLFAGSGVAWSLYLGVDTLPGNVFSTSDCFDARLQGVQSGQLVNSASGAQSVTISTVDTAASFLLFSINSNSNEPDESQVMGRLLNATTVEFTRMSDGSPVPAINIEWSIVEYACGVSVQRGTLVGDGTTQIDVPLTSIDPASSFVLGTSVPAAGSTVHARDDLQIFELANPTTLRIRSAGATLDPARQLAWQVITFNAPGDAATQTLSTTLGAGVGSDNLTLATPVDPGSTFVLASIASSATGPEIGERMVRVRLVDSTTVEVIRLRTTESVEVHLQVVELLDGSTVEHGFLNLASAETAASAVISPVDTSRSVAFSPVMVPGSSSGGATDFAGDDIVGEGSATVRLGDPTTVTVTRGSALSAASFSWQVVTWGGPGWVDPSSTFRQRIDITAGSVDSPTGYTTPLDLNHRALVDSGISLTSGDDVRIWRFDGVTWTELDRVLDQSANWNTTDTRLWFRTQESIAATTTISYWLYLGDPTPSPVLDDPANVWLLTEDFEGAGLGFFEDRTAGNGWYKALPWTRRIILTIDQTAVDTILTNQPVLVRVVDPDLSASAQLDGSDLRFTAADGITDLPHEIESWDSTTGTLSAWVRAPLLSPVSDTTIHLYYGAADAPAQTNPRLVWSDEIAAWNLTRDPGEAAPTLDDSGPAQHDGLALGNTSLITTPTGLGADLDGTTDRLESAPFNLPTAPFSLAVWFRADALGANDPVLISQGDPTATGVFELDIDTTTTPGSPTGRFRIRIGGSVVEVSGGAVVAGAWHHLAATWDGTTITLYLNGAVVGSGLASGATPNGSTTPMVLGGDSAGLRTLDGIIDQVRISAEAWTAARVRFTETNLQDPTTTIMASAPTGGSWFGQGDWAMRRPLAIAASQVPGSLTNYPLLVQLLDLDLAANAQTDGDDLVFVGADGISRLDYEIESWDPVSGELMAWVRLPNLSPTTDTKLFLYLANPLAVGQSDAVGVWGPEADLVLNG